MEIKEKPQTDLPNFKVEIFSTLLELLNRSSLVK